MSQPKFTAVLSNKDKIETALKATPGAIASLTTQFQMEKWIKFTEKPSATGLVEAALGKIEIDENEMDAFIRMLNDVTGLSQIVKILQVVSEESVIDTEETNAESQPICPQYSFVSGQDTAVMFSNGTPTQWQPGTKEIDTEQRRGAATESTHGNYMGVSKPFQSAEAYSTRVDVVHSENTLSEKEQGIKFEDPESEHSHVHDQETEGLRKNERRGVVDGDKENLERLFQEKSKKMKQLLEEKDEEIRLRENKNKEMQRLLEEKGEEIQQLLKDKDRQMRLVEENDKQIQRLLEHKDKELQQLREEKDIEIQRLLEDKDNEMQRLREEKSEEMQQLREDRDKQIKQWRVEKDEEIQRLLREKDKKIQQLLDKEIRQLLEEKKKEIKRLCEAKDEEILRLLEEKEKEIQRLRRVTRSEKYVIGGSVTIQEPIKLVHCKAPEMPTSSSYGSTYYDKQNEIYVKIPQGAIPQDVSLDIDVTLSLFGPPSQYPEGLQPISPVVWVCARGQEGFQFLTPIEISLPHYLNIDCMEDCKSMGLTVLKSGHNANDKNKHNFSTCDDVSLSIDSDLKNHFEFKISHFCYLCIAAKKSPETSSRSRYRCTEVESEDSIHFYITYSLPTCTASIKEKSTILSKCKLRSKEFKLNPQKDTNASLNIMSKPKVAKGWNVDLKYPDQVISITDIYFWEESEETMREKNELNMYPPHFEIQIDGSEATGNCFMKVEFVGDIWPQKCLDTNVFLKKTAQPTFSASSGTTETTKPLTDPLDIDRDFFTAKGVLEHLDKDELKYLFMELGLNYKTVQNKYDSPLNVYMNSLLEAWIFKRDLVVEKGGATWENLRAALERRGYRGHAEKI